ncbi:glycosyltransferase family 4 protein [Mucilaginibacter jinjuensis]|uniref:Glycosyltransferase family 4 protein n=1 Tax=Mucilaginibacter jinjuensis TaxID=1176721 RepID=A0ABY7TDP9_9SPHI|nr:glycosyltransferase family 4 protein [Mucilaginibacter jinjuensis]WCT14596.1 glycosyltransferase family 4 protein [Mucilaginibacter jinjuensis]
MIKLVDVTYYTHLEYHKPEQVLEKHHLVTRYAEFLRDKMQVQFVKHAGFEGFSLHNGLLYNFFKGINKFRYLPFKANRFISKQQPDVVLVQGLVFPLQVILLRMQCKRNCKIIVQHHGELPFKGMKLVFQKLASKCVDAYLFTSAGNADEWKQKGVIANKQPIFEVLEASTNFFALDKTESRKKLKFHTEGNVFLWVGRLNENKSPLTIIKAFAQYLNFKPSSRLYMIYHTTEQLDKIKALIYADEKLESAVYLLGRIPHDKLPLWFSAADYYLSGSFKEGSGYALLEAMACGCVPVISDIPPFRKIIENGKYGYLYKAGDERALSKTLCGLETSPISPDDVIGHFNQNLSFNRIAEDVYRACKLLVH